MTRAIAGLLGVVMAMGLSSATAAYAADQCAYANPGDARALAERAAAHLDAVGPNRAFPEFMDPQGDFVDRDLYVFVIDFRGVLMASGGFPDSIGSMVVDARDRNGRPYIREMLQLAREQEQGWIEYEMVHPCTGEMTPKISYVKRVGPVIVGVGAFGTLGA